MIEYVEDLIGLQLKRLQDSGAMDNNPYSGKPLDFTEYLKAPEETRAINRVLADSGFKPPKLQALCDLRDKEQQYKSQPCEDLRKEINQLRLKYQVLR